jgi:hypothetical protein
MSRWKLLMVLMLLLAGGGLAYAQTSALHDLTWWTVDVGGDMTITGGDYELWSTVGQADAALDVSGGAYTIQSGFWPSTIQRALIYLPLVIKPGTPDLVGSFNLTPNKTSFNAGEPVQITAVITNVGTAPAGAFWTDFYINPSRVPEVNLRWNDICGMTPCYGIAWYVSGGLAPGASVTLVSSCSDPAVYPQPPCYGALYSIWPGSFASGTSDLYLYVDMWNPTVPTGGVAESDEDNNMAELHGLRVTGLRVGGANLPSPADLPPRPVRLGR